MWFAEGDNILDTFQVKVFIFVPPLIGTLKKNIKCKRFANKKFTGKIYVSLRYYTECRMTRKILSLEE